MRPRLATRPLLPIATATLVVLAGCAQDDPAPDDPAADAPSTPEGDEAPGEGGEDDPSAADDPADDAADGDDTGDADDATDEDDAGDGSDPSGGADDVDGLEFTRCESDDIDIDHPASWTAYEGEDVPPCRVFHPEEIESFEGESLHYAVRLYIDPVEFEEATDSPLSEELSRDEVTVDGRHAVRIERRSEGEAMLPEGERRYSYVVQLDDGEPAHEHGLILVATTTTVGDTDYERDRRVLDRMMETIAIDVDDEV